MELTHPSKDIGECKLLISGSKSESNRALILQSLLKAKWLLIDNLSDSQDTQLMETALCSPKKVIDIHHAGTAMRFLTAYFATQAGREIILTGSPRMKNRPIGILVDALRQLGAEIEYLEKKGFPPLLIKGKRLTKGKVTLPSNISSQYVSALMLIGIAFKKGLTINLEGEITSYPYLNMTMETILKIGKAVESRIEVDWIDNKRIRVFNHDPANLKEANKKFSLKKYFIESDWSSASYHYGIMALAEQGSIKLSAFDLTSIQGDSRLIDIYKNNFNVFTATAHQQAVLLYKSNNPLPKTIELNLNDCPDIAQTILVTASALKIPCKLTGLHTLKIKETDRLIAMQKELSKCNVTTEITDDSIEITHIGNLPKKITIETYNDHRMAMAFAPLALMGVELKIKNKAVVDKSYPNFWEHLNKLNFQIKP